MNRSGFIVLAFATALVPARLASQDAPATSRNNCFRDTEPVQCEIKAGVDSYKNAKYEAAIAHFRRAVSLDSKLVQAHLYLATALAQQFIPGVETPDNSRNAEQAIAEYSTVERQATQGSIEEMNALGGIAGLYFQMKKFNDAKDYYRKLIDIYPNDAEPYYSIAVIDWTESYSARMKAYAKLGIKPEEQHWDVGTCQRFAGEHLPEVEDGMQMLVKALEVRHDYDDAMAYMNLLYRERADLQCYDAAARKADLVKADQWVDATLAAKKAKAEQGQQSPSAMTAQCLRLR
jgi:tetratricopeptide (TPR) repeat protein